MSLSVDLVGAQVLGAGGGLAQAELGIGGGRIVPAQGRRRVDLAGYLVLPGIVDLHGDGFERHLAPRRGAMTQIAEGVIAAEAELAANGITTGVLAQFLSWEGGLRGPQFADEVFTAIAAARPTVATDLRGQARVETHLLDILADLPERLARWGVDYVVFNDHLPHARLAEGKRPPRLTGQALKAGRNPDRHFEILLDLHRRGPDVPAALDAVCAVLRSQGVRIGSHDDRGPAEREAWRARGARISEFPETVAAAEAARAAGDAVILGAPNVVRGGSHKGNVSALDLIAMGLCDAVASDYHYPSPRRAALMLVDSGICDWPAAWALISEGPARILGLADRGRLEPGLRADLCILDATTRRVAATVAGGHVSYMTGAIAERFVTA